MKLEKDYEDFISLLNEHKVRFVVVGAYAVSFHARPRNTGDIDFFIDDSEDNIKKLLSVLRSFGFENMDLSVDDFKGDDNILQLGYEPVRIDILTGLSGVKFENVYENRIEGKLGSQTVYFISLNDLIKNKRATNRTQDKADLEILAEVRRNEMGDSVS